MYLFTILQPFYFIEKSWTAGTFNIIICKKVGRFIAMLRAWPSRELAVAELEHGAWSMTFDTLSC